MLSRALRAWPCHSTPQSLTLAHDTPHPHTQAAADRAVEDTESLALSLDTIEKEKAVAAELGRLRATAVQDRERAEITLRYLKAQVRMHAFFWLDLVVVRKASSSLQRSSR